jgi:mannitol-1-phosphate/altronate dehydrogenase
MEEMLSALKLNWDLDHSFLEWYASKELSRFRCDLLYDPVSRVAREPLRKLELDGRLMGAAQLCLAQGFVPKSIIFGIGAALMFESRTDQDRHLKIMRDSLSENSLFHYVLGLRKGDVLERILRQGLPRVFSELDELKAEWRNST